MLEKIRYMDFIKNNNSLLNKDFNLYVRGIAIIFIIIAHIYQFLISKSFSNSTLNYLSMIFAQCSVGAFFFVSGYGNYFSIQKNKNIKWLIKKVIHFYLTMTPLLLIIWLCRCHFNFIVFKSHILHIINDIAVLGLNGGYWYLKIQLLAYILLFITQKYFKNWAMLGLIILAASYVLYGFLHEMNLCRWFTFLCFPFGCIVAKYNDFFKEISLKYIKQILFSVIILGILIICDINFKTSGLMMIPISAFVCFYIMVISLYDFALPQFKIINLIGSYSLELYIVHMGYLCFLKHSSINFPHYIIINILILCLWTTIGSILLQKFSNLICKNVYKKGSKC